MEPPATVRALYTSLEQETAFAETRRQSEKRGKKASELGPRDYVVMELHLTRVLDLTTEGFFREAGITRQELLAAPELCLQIADEARAVDAEAILVPSAAGTGNNLVVYLDQLQPGWAMKEVQREQNVTL